MATIPTILTEPILVAKLPLPPDVAEEVERICRSRRFTRRDRARLEEQVRLQHHYGGHGIVVTADPPGLQIHAIDLDNPEAYHELRERLRAQGYRHVLSL